MSFLRVWIHSIWSTKNRIEYFNEDNIDKIFSHIYGYALNKGIFIKRIGGYYDHIHCLFSLNATQEISQIIALLKGESSFWINKEKIIRGKFSWQKEYLAVSVSESIQPRVVNYIKNQKIHHSQIPYLIEVDQIIKKYKININRDDLLK